MNRRVSFHCPDCGRVTNIDWEEPDFCRFCGYPDNEERESEDGSDETENQTNP